MLAKWLEARRSGSGPQMRSCSAFCKLMPSAAAKEETSMLATLAVMEDASVVPGGQACVSYGVMVAAEVSRCLCCRVQTRI